MQLVCEKTQQRAGLVVQFSTSGLIWAVSYRSGRLLFTVCVLLFSGQGSDSAGAPGCRLDPLSQPRPALQQMGREVGQGAAGRVHFKHGPIMHKVSQDPVFLPLCPSPVWGGGRWRWGTGGPPPPPGGLGDPLR